MENEERRIKVPTTGVFDFPSLILGGKGKYVDKTELLYQLANDADQQRTPRDARRYQLQPEEAQHRHADHRESVKCKVQSWN